MLSNRYIRISFITAILIAMTALSSCTRYNAREISSHYSKSVVLICNMYYLTAEDDSGDTLYIGRDITGTEVKQSRDKQRLLPFITFGTGFFVSKNGMMVTNSHIAYPWEARISELDQLHSNKEIVENLNHEPVFVGIIPNGSMIDLSTSENLATVANKIAQTFYQCDIMTRHTDENVDLALIQMQARTLPPNTSFIKPDTIATHAHDFKKGSDIFMMGFPGGLSFATTRKTLYREIENTLSNGIISKISDKYNIQYTLSTGGGSSGAPVFSREGKVIAVNYAVSDLQGALINYGIKAGYIHDMLDEFKTVSLKGILAIILVRLLLLFIPLAVYNIYRIIRDDILDLHYAVYGSIKISMYVGVSLIILIMNGML